MAFRKFIARYFRQPLTGYLLKVSNKDIRATDRNVGPVSLLLNWNRYLPIWESIVFWNLIGYQMSQEATQPVFICSKLTVEAPEQSVNLQKRHQTNIVDDVLEFLLLTLHILLTFLVFPLLILSN